MMWFDRDTTDSRPGEALASVSAASAAGELCCVGCGYDLVGLRREGRCPECGRAVRDSFRGDALELADRDWLGGLVLGARMARLGAQIFIGVVLALIAIVVLGLFGVGSTFIPPLVQEALIVVLRLVAPVPVLTGLLLLTSPEPREVLTDGLTDRAKARWGALFVAALAVAAYSIASMAPAGLATRVLHDIAVVIAIATGTIPAVAILRHLRMLALRLPDAKLASDLLSLAKRVRWLLPLLSIVIAIVRASVLLPNAKASTSLGGLLISGVVLVYGVATFIAVFGSIVSVFGFLGLLTRFASAINDVGKRIVHGDGSAAAAIGS